MHVVGQETLNPSDDEINIIFLTVIMVSSHPSAEVRAAYVMLSSPLQHLSNLMR